MRIFLNIVISSGREKNRSFLRESEKGERRGGQVPNKIIKERNETDVSKFSLLLFHKFLKYPMRTFNLSIFLQGFGSFWSV